MDIHIHLHHHEDEKVALRLETIMATQQEVVQKLNDLTTQIDKVGAEIGGLKTQVTDLQGRLDRGDVPPDVVAAINKLADGITRADDMVPDVAPPA